MNKRSHLLGMIALGIILAGLLWLVQYLCASSSSKGDAFPQRVTNPSTKTESCTPARKITVAPIREVVENERRLSRTAGTLAQRTDNAKEPGSVDRIRIEKFLEAWNEDKDMRQAAYDALGREALSTLYGMLREQEYAALWYRIAATISMLAPNGDRASAECIVTYACRWDDWENVSRNGGDFVREKCLSIALLGPIGGEYAEGILKSALSVEGASDLITAWRGKKMPEHWSEETVIMMLRSGAAYGLGATMKQENLQLVEDEYHRVLAEVKTRLALGETAESAEDLRESYGFLGQLISALANRDACLAYGQERMSLMSLEERTNLTIPFTRNYEHPGRKRIQEVPSTAVPQ